MSQSARVFNLDNVTEKDVPLGKNVLVGGCFDILHIGHIKFLKAARKEGENVIVALESDQFIQKSKKKSPFHTQKERAEVLAAVRYVDMVILLPLMKNDSAYFQMVGKIKPHVIAVTEGDTQIENKKKQAKEVNAQVKIVLTHQKNISSTAISQFYLKNS